MSDVKWTAGPWSYEPTDYPGLEGTVVGQMGRVMQADHGEYTICQLCDFSEDELLANAHLIAAAPELYEALERVLGDISGEGDYTGLRPEYAYAALAKARGETGGQS